MPASAGNLVVVEKSDFIVPDSRQRQRANLYYPRHPQRADDRGETELNLRQITRTGQ